MMEATDDCEKGFLGQENQSESDAPLLTAENINELHTVPLDSEPPQCQNGHVVVCPRCGRVRTLERPPPPEQQGSRHCRRLKSCCWFLFYTFLALTIVFAWILFIYMAYERFPYQSVQDSPKKPNDRDDFIQRIQHLGSRL